MKNAELLQELSTKIHSGDIRPDEVLHLLQAVDHHVMSAEHSLATRRSFSVAKTLYVVGAAIVLIGIILFLSRIWGDVGMLGRMSLSLGLGIIFAVNGSLILRKKPADILGPVLHCIGAVLIPFGALLFVFELRLDSDWTIMLVFALHVVAYLLFQAAHRHSLFPFFILVHATLTYYFFVHAVLGGRLILFYNVSAAYQFAAMLIGLCYLFLSYYFRTTWNRSLIHALHILGSCTVLCAGYLNVTYLRSLWIIFYFFMIAAFMYVSVLMKSRSILAITTLFLLAYVAYITRHFFVDSIGWPISLVILGLACIGIGYVSVAMSKRYISAVADASSR